MTPTHTVYKSLRDFTTTFSASPYNHFPRRSRGLVVDGGGGISFALRFLVKKNFAELQKFGRAKSMDKNRADEVSLPR